MRFQLTLKRISKSASITLNYAYPLSAAIYKIIQRADETYSAFLHDKGYGKGFKLFTFSSLVTPFIIAGDRMVMKTDTAVLHICFHLPEAAGHFITGLFLHQQLEIADAKSRVSFAIEQVTHITDPLTDKDGLVTTVLEPLSPIVAGLKNERGHYDFRSPEEPDFIDGLLYNWMEKYMAIYPESQIIALQQQMKMNILLLSRKPQQRLITIKQGTPQETKIKGYTRFLLQVTAPKEMVELALGAGLGLYSSQGFGAVMVKSSL